MEKCLLSIFHTHSPSQTERKQGGGSNDNEKTMTKKEKRKIGIKQARVRQEVSLQEYMRTSVEMGDTNML